MAAARLGLAGHPAHLRCLASPGDRISPRPAHRPEVTALNAVLPEGDPRAIITSRGRSGRVRKDRTMSPMRKRMLALLCLGAVALFIAACNTIEGIGEDFSAAGDGLSNMANDANPSDD